MRFKSLRELSHPESDWIYPLLSKHLQSNQLNCPEATVEIIHHIERTFTQTRITDFTKSLSNSIGSPYLSLVMAFAHHRLGQYRTSAVILLKEFSERQSGITYNLLLRSLVSDADIIKLASCIASQASSADLLDRGTVLEIASIYDTQTIPSERRATLYKTLSSFPDTFLVASIFSALKEGRYDEAYRMAEPLRTSLVPIHFSTSAMSSVAYHLHGPFRRDEPRGVRATSLREFSLRMLPHWGRLGQQMTEYLTARQIAASADLSVSTPNWIGSYLFDINDPPINEVYRRLAPIEKLEECYYSIGYTAIQNRDVNSPGQLLNWSEETTRLARNIFKFKPFIENYFQSKLNDTGISPTHLIAIHFRASDQTTRFNLPELRWYTGWAEELLLKECDNLSLYFASDELDKYLPIISIRTRVFCFKDLGIPEELAWLADFYILSKSRYVAISHSAFSAMASIINENLIRAVQPDFKQMKLVPFDTNTNKFTGFSPNKG